MRSLVGSADQSCPLIVTRARGRLPHTAGQGRTKSYQTYVLTKIGGEWLIKSFQNTKAQPVSVWQAVLLPGENPLRAMRETG
jgi:hypothetical protein